MCAVHPGLTNEARVCQQKPYICCLAPIFYPVDVFFFIFRVYSVTYTADAFQIVTGGSGCDDYTKDLSGVVSLPAGGERYYDFGM